MKTLTKQEISSSAAAQTTHESSNKYAPTSFVGNHDKESSIIKDKESISTSFSRAVLKTATLALNGKEPTTSETIEINMKTIYSQNKKPDSQQRIESIHNEDHPTVTKAREIVKSALRTENWKLPANKPSSLKLKKPNISIDLFCNLSLKLVSIKYHKNYHFSKEIDHKN